MEDVAVDTQECTDIKGILGNILSEMKTLKKQNNQIVEQNTEMKNGFKSYKDLINAELSDIKRGIENLQTQINDIGKSQEFISSQYESHRAMHTSITN